MLTLKKYYNNLISYFKTLKLGVQMKSFYNLLIILFLSFVSLTFSQSFDGDWSAEYVTSDNPDSLNSVGWNVISVTTLAEDSFVALANRGSANAYYLVAFRDAGPNSGRLGYYEYQPSLQTKWINIFDQEYVYDANDLASNGNLVFVPNNDSVSNSILVFEVKEDSIYSYPQRYKVNAYIWAIDIDDNGRVYVTKTGDDTTPGSVLILENPDTAPAWVPNGNSGTVLQEFSLPDPGSPRGDIGSPRGLTVNGDGTVLYVSNHNENKIYCYVGDPINGYSLYDGFDFSVDDQFQASTELLDVGPFGLQLMPDKNLLFVAHDVDFSGGEGYEYARMYIANPNTGEVLDTIDVAEWNYSIHNSYTDRQTGIASGFASTYAVDFDENYNVYSQSWYGWTVEKFIYSGELPTIELIITSVEKVNETLPSKFSLEQNYPNPFNPSTTIQFDLNESQEVSLSVFNINGQRVTDLIKSTNFSAGSYKISFDASKLSSGTYLYVLKAGNNQMSKKMTLLK